jgi:eukaryotic-like serine/threonine-protein kinase
VVDFGLVKDVDGDIKVSSDQTTAGTPPYMSPEAIQAPEQVEARSDLYSLGALGYHLLTGCNVFEARNLFELFAHHVATPPVPPSQRVSGPVPADLERLILGCLAKDVAGRPPSARALHDALAACTEPGPWSESEARDWWARHGASRAAAPHRAPDTTEVTVVLPLKVDLAERMGPPGA